MRNPLYLDPSSSRLALRVAARDVWVAVVVLAMFVLIYVPVIRAEETFLRKQFSGL